MLRFTTTRLHNIQDRGANKLSFPFSDLTKLYRDSTSVAKETTEAPADSPTAISALAAAAAAANGNADAAATATTTTAATGDAATISSSTTARRLSRSTTSSSNNKRLSITGHPLTLRHSGQQLEVLALYRSMLRAAAQKEAATSPLGHDSMSSRSTTSGASSSSSSSSSIKPSFFFSSSPLLKAIRAEFHENAPLPRRHVTKIEWLMHRGRSKLEDIKAMRQGTRYSVVGG